MHRKDKFWLERSKRAWEMRQQAMSFGKIAKTLGHTNAPSRPISRVTAMKLVQQWQSRLNRPEGVPVNMTTRAFKTLQTASEKTGEPVTKELARNLIETRVLSRTQHCGPMTSEEIKEWAYS